MSDYQILHGDCIEVMREMPENSVDAIVTDPPYNLSTARKSVQHCLARMVAEVHLPHDEQRDAQVPKGLDLPFPGSDVSFLDVASGSGINARVGVPERPIDFESASVVQEEIENGSVSAPLGTDDVLPNVSHIEAVEDLGDFILQLADAGDGPACDGTCSCFAEFAPGRIGMTVSAILPPTRPDFLGRFRRAFGNHSVGMGDNTFAQSGSPSSVVTGAGAEDGFVLRLDLRGRTGECVAANGAGVLGRAFLLVPTEFVGASTRAGSLSSELEAFRVGFVRNGTHWTFTLHVPAPLSASLNFTKNGGFMGKTWDGWESPAAYQRWCRAWASEAYRVLKPGGFLLSFGGTRTYHRMVCGIEDAGFDIRDCLQYLYGVGFPKSLDVSKAIDKAVGVEGEYGEPKSDAHAGWIERGRMRGEDGHEGYQRPWMKDEDAVSKNARQYIPSADAAKRYAGFGTALKPANEPVVLARKPLSSTVAANVLAYGTGALNIDGCRVGDDSITTHSRGRNDAFPKRPGETTAEESGRRTGQGSIDTELVRTGRWPANVILDESAAQLLDAQSGYSVSQGGDHSGRHGTRDVVGGFGFDRTEITRPTDSGGASRFFYTAKASRAERGEGNTHPTVKPVDLMRWLVRLVTPPGGTVLDPFAGSGTTLVAALNEGFDAIGVEREDEYVEIIRRRLAGQQMGFALSLDEPA